MEKIIQLIASPDLYAEYKIDAGTSKGEVPFIALSETGDIHFIDFDEVGMIYDVTEVDNFVRLIRR